jgi:hypothetical protein
VNIGKVCHAHPKLKGERLKNGTCKGCQNEMTKRYGQLTRDKAKKFDALVEALDRVLDDPDTAMTPANKASLIRLMR